MIEILWKNGKKRKWLKYFSIWKEYLFFSITTKRKYQIWVNFGENLGLVYFQLEQHVLANQV
jgi:hypothetical protein